MAWYRRFVNLMRSERLSRDLEREMAFHLSERTDELVAGGWSEPEARREAGRRFGNRTLQKERMRDADVLVWLESLLADLRYGARALRASPGFALVAILSLGLGIGANTAIFSLIDAVMLKSLPVSHPEELVQVRIGDNDELTNPIWEQLRDRKDLFSSVFAFSGGQTMFDLASGGESRPVPGSWVSGGFFAGLGVRPAAGRLLRPADDFRGCPAVAVLGYGFWQSRYGGEAGAVGKTISLDGHSFTILGVTGPGFFGVDVGRSPRVYAPLCAEAVVRGPRSMLDNRAAWMFNIMGRPLPGLTPEQLRARLAAVSPAVFTATLPTEFDAEGQREYLKNTLGFQEAAKGLSQLRLGYRGALFVLMGVVGLVLLIACANVANLLLARAAVRRREIAVRLSIGAGRQRLVRQLLTESVLLSLMGAALGVPFAHWGSRLLVSFFSTRKHPTWLDLAIDGRMLAFTIAVATATGILFGLAPAWQATRIDPQSAMKENGRGIVEGSSRFSLGKALVIGQVALSLVLVAVAGLLLGSFRKLATLDPGFRSDGVLLVTMAPSAAQAGAGPRGYGDTRETLDRLRALPGVRSASASELTPVSGQGWNGEIVVDGYTPQSPREAIVWFNAVSDGYFSTLGTRLVLGRDFDGHEGPGSPRVAVINEATARKFFRGTNPLGKKLRVREGDGANPPVEIIGVVADAKYRTLREEAAPTAYLPMSQQEEPGPSYSFELRTDGPVAALVPAVRELLGRESPGASYTLTTLAAQVDESLTRERLLATLSGFFGGLALLLAGIGLYGTVAYSVARRRHEIAIRLTLGALRTRVLRMVLGEVGWMVGAGIGLGLLLALATTRWVASFLFGLTASDPLTLTIAAAILAAVALVAGALPAWRAARLDPVVSLRED